MLLNQDNKKSYVILFYHHKNEVTSIEAGKFNCDKIFDINDYIGQSVCSLSYRFKYFDIEFDISSKTIEFIQNHFKNSNDENEKDSSLFNILIVKYQSSEYNESNKQILYAINIENCSITDKKITPYMTCDDDDYPFTLFTKVVFEEVSLITFYLNNDIKQEYSWEKNI